MHINTSYSYDPLDRISSVVYNGVGSASNFQRTVTYAYKNDDTYGETGLVEAYTSTVGSNSSTYVYTYDSDGNIVGIMGGGASLTYSYDDIGQLNTEKNLTARKIYSYSYDNSGNITQIVTKYATTGVTLSTTSFLYEDSDWGDLLIAVGNSPITYDEIGNPLTYYNGMQFTWEGRRLVGATDGTNTYSFTYNDEGLRTSKTKNGVTTNYYYDGTLLVKEESSSHTVVYIYDVNASPIGFKFHHNTYAEGVWDEYFYEKNLHGDIVAVYDEYGTKNYSYTYNAWGLTVKTQETASPTTGFINPYTYRGYYYDSDLGLYYLQSRYYDPNICRFINADDESLIIANPTALTDKNLFSYCDNNPVMRVDHSGEFWHILIGGFFGGLIEGFGSFLTQRLNEEKIDWVEVGISAAAGFANGALDASGVKIGIIILGFAGISMGENAINQAINNNGFKNFDVKDMLIDGFKGGIAGALNGPGKGSKHLTKLGVQSVKRPFKAGIHNGIGVGFKEVKGAFKYYAKSSAHYYKDFFPSVLDDLIQSFTKSYAYYFYKNISDR